MQETRVQSLGQEDPLEKEMATHSSTLAWKIPWTEDPGRLQSMGLQRVGHDWATSLHFKPNPRNPFEYSVPLDKFSQGWGWGVKLIEPMESWRLRRKAVFLNLEQGSYNIPPYRLELKLFYTLLLWPIILTIPPIFCQDW